MASFFSLVEDVLDQRRTRKAEVKRLRALLRKIEEKERTDRSPPPSRVDDIVGWKMEEGRRVKKSSFETVLEQIESVDVRTIKPYVDNLRSIMDQADELDVRAEPFTLAFVGPPRQGKTQLSLNILRILGALGIICVERSAQDPFCDDIARSSDEARDARDDIGRYKYFPNVEDQDLRAKKCKAEVLFLDEFQSKIVNPHDVPLVLNGVIPLKWMPPMADLKLKGMSFNPVIWIMSCNNEFVQHDYSVTAIRDRLHSRLVVLDGKAYKQTCLKNMSPSGNFLGGFSTCKGTFGVWEKYVTQETVGKSVGSTSSNAYASGFPPSNTRTAGRSVANSYGSTVSNQKFREVRDTLSVTKPRCSHMVMVSFTELIVDLLDSARAKLEVALNGTKAVNARIDSIRKTMAELSADIYPAERPDEYRPTSVSSGFVSMQESTGSDHAMPTQNSSRADGLGANPGLAKHSLF